MTRLEELFRVVLELRRSPEVEASAQLLRRSVRYARLGVVLTGVLLGAGSVMGLTTGDGTRPINVLYLIALTMLLPILSLLMTAWVTRRLVKGRESEGVLSDLATLALKGGWWLASRALETRDKPTQLRIQASLGLLRGDFETVKPVLPWLLRSLTQGFSLALGAGFVGALLLRQLSIDLSFGWQTTGHFLEEVLPIFLRVLSAPLGWMSSDFVPSAELLHATRFSRFSGAFRGGPGTDQLSWEWMPFLLAGAVFWGVLPRVLTLLWYRLRLHREVGRVLESLRPQLEVLRHLQSPVFTAPQPETQPLASQVLRTEAAERVRSGQAGTELRAEQRASAMLKGALLSWQQVATLPAPIRERMQRKLNVSLELRRTFGHQPERDRALLTELKNEGVQLVVLHVEPFQPPGAGFRRQLGELRQALGASTPIVVHLGWYEAGVLKPSSSRQIEVWVQSLQKLGDRAIHWHVAETLEESRT